MDISKGFNSSPINENNLQCVVGEIYQTTKQLHALLSSEETTLFMNSFTDLEPVILTDSLHAENINRENASLVNMQHSLFKMRNALYDRFDSERRIHEYMLMRVRDEEEVEVQARLQKMCDSFESVSKKFSKFQCAFEERQINVSNSKTSQLNQTAVFEMLEKACSDEEQMRCSLGNAKKEISRLKLIEEKHRLLESELNSANKSISSWKSLHQTVSDKLFGAEKDQSEIAAVLTKIISSAGLESGASCLQSAFIISFWCQDLLTAFPWIKSKKISNMGTQMWDLNQNPYDLLQKKKEKLIERENKIASFNSFIDELGLEIADLKLERTRLHEQSNKHKNYIEKLELESEHLKSKVHQYREAFDKLFDPEVAQQFADQVKAKSERRAQRPKVMEVDSATSTSSNLSSAFSTPRLRVGGDNQVNHTQASTAQSEQRTCTVVRSHDGGHHSVISSPSTSTPTSSKTRPTAHNIHVEHRPPTALTASTAFTVAKDKENRPTFTKSSTPLATEVNSSSNYHRQPYLNLAYTKKSIQKSPVEGEQKRTTEQAFGSRTTLKHSMTPLSSDSFMTTPATRQSHFPLPIISAPTSSSGNQETVEQTSKKQPLGLFGDFSNKKLDSMQIRLQEKYEIPKPNSQARFCVKQEEIKPMPLQRNNLQVNTDRIDVEPGTRWVQRTALSKPASNIEATDCATS